MKCYGSDDTNADYELIYACTATSTDALPAWRAVGELLESLHATEWLLNNAPELLDRLLAAFQNRNLNVRICYIEWKRKVDLHNLIIQISMTASRLLCTLLSGPPSKRTSNRAFYLLGSRLNVECSFSSLLASMLRDHTNIDLQLNSLNLLGSLIQTETYMAWDFINQDQMVRRNISYSITTDSH